jgi:inward rectifier potassium channel
MSKQAKDPGLGQRVDQSFNRSINKDGSFNVKRVGFGYNFKNTYQTIIKISWNEQPRGRAPRYRC